MDKDYKNISKKGYLGVEPDDISEEDSMAVDLHMGITEISDFLETLKDKGMVTEKIDLSEIDTVGELIEALNKHYEI